MADNLIQRLRYEAWQNPWASEAIDDAVTEIRRLRALIAEFDDAFGELNPDTMRPLAEDFYVCPNTGEWVYKWSDERMVLITSEEARSLRGHGLACRER